jgi:hypothetical protein
MLCEQCGEHNSAANRFCQGCGVPLSVTCLTCEHTNPSGSAFCGACGGALETASRPTHPPAVPHVINVVRGELKQVTVLFADLVSSTELGCATKCRRCNAAPETGAEYHVRGC